MKKNILQRRAELQQLGVGGIGFGSPIMITGFYQNHNIQIGRVAQNNIPKPPSQTATRTRTLPKPH